MIGFLVWYLLGLAGAYLLWRFYRREKGALRDATGKFIPPSRGAILWWFFFALLGVVLLLIGLWMHLVFFLGKDYSRSAFAQWLRKPLWSLK